MKCLVVAALLSAAGCQDVAPPAAVAAEKRVETKAPPPQQAAVRAEAKAPDAYAGDIRRICDAVALSGAADVETTDRAFLVAQWLGSNLSTRESREFLVRIQPMTGEPKAKALVAEAQRVGLDDCALAAEWRRPPTP
jgi:hypothetical protein